MAIKLRDGETIKAEAHFHWSAFFLAKLLAGLGIIVFFASLLGALVGRQENVVGAFFGATIMAVCLCLPFAFKWLQNKFKKYVVTNQRIYIEVGVLSRLKNDLPLNKINDVSLSQGILQRMLGSGSIIILMGNDKPTIIPDIDQADEFKDAISEMIGNRAA